MNRFLLLITLCAGTVSAVADTKVYEFVGAESNITVTGGIAGVNETYMITGRFRLELDLEAATASFKDVNLVLRGNGSFDGYIFKDILNMELLTGTVVDNNTIQFTGQEPQGQEVLIEVMLSDSSLQLTVSTMMECCDRFQYELSAVAEELSPEILYAEILALETSGELRPPQELVERIATDLAAIYSAYPGMTRIGPGLRWVPSELLIGLTDEAWIQYRAGTYTGLDLLNEIYGPVIVEDITFFLLLTFTELYNPEVLGEIYSAAEGVNYAEPNGIFGISRKIVAVPPLYTFTYGWGDCPVGCLNGHAWKFSVIEGQVELLSETGAPLDPDFPIDPIDFDLDNVANDVDNCPVTSNRDQKDTDTDTMGDACDNDDDNDGMTDNYEINNGLDPLNDSDANLDLDGDGITNLQEFGLGTAANNPDTDGDGMNDGAELELGRNPKVNEVIVMLIINSILDE